ncbi:hypothetical protein [Sedimenticola sp.]|uniref:hypothetical protein n=1 Tax=Sedimenticola sp. TaxID=1940285 RepID=UPI003D0CF4B0
MKLLSKALIIASLSLAALTQAQAGPRHQGNNGTSAPGIEQQQVAWNGYDDGHLYYRGNSGKQRHHHGNRSWRHRTHDRYWVRKHYWKRHDRPSYRYSYQYDHRPSSGTIIFRW